MHTTTARELAAFVDEAERGKHGGTNATVSVLLDAWLADVERNTSPATMANYRQAVESSLRPALGHKSLRSLGARSSTPSTRPWGVRGRART